MKCLTASRSSPAGGIVATILAAGLIFGATIASAYIDEDRVVERNEEGVWFVSPCNDPERDADTLQYVVDYATTGDTIVLEAGTFDFGPEITGDPDDQRSVTVSKRVTILGQILKGGPGVVREFCTVVAGSEEPFLITAQGVNIEGVYIRAPGERPLKYTPPTIGGGVVLNMSIRVPLIHGAVAIPGLVITEGPQKMMFRAVGPALGVYGVENIMGDPRIELYKDGKLIAMSCDWCACPDKGAAARTTCERVGAFPLPEDSLDAVIVTTLDPGAYTIMVKDEDGFSGSVLFEMYTVGI